MFALTNGDKELLEHLAVNGPRVGNQIANLQNASRTAHRLEELGLVSRIAGKYDPNPRPARLLYLTIIGLPHALLCFFMKNNAVRLLDQAALDDLNRIVNHWHNLLPDVFDKWNHFRTENVDHIAAGRLVYAAHSVANHLESMARAGHLWTPGKIATPEKHTEVVLTRFFYDVVYDPTFFRDAYLARWVQSQSQKTLDISDSPLVLWVDALKKDPDTRKKIDENIRIAHAEIGRMKILSSLLESRTVDVAKMEKSLALLTKVFYT